MSILSTITGGIWKYVAIAGIGLGLAVGGFFYGRHVGVEVSKVAIANFTASKDSELTEVAAIQSPVVYKIITQYVTRTVHIKDVGETNDKIITSTVADHGILSTGFVYDYNTSITGSPIDPTLSANGASSGLTAAQALVGIADNNTICLSYKEQVIGLQAYINGYNAAVSKANADAKKGKK
jgi:hypothetical protein